VLATLWPIDADVAVRFTAAIYDELVTDGTLQTAGTAVAVHCAVRAARAAEPDRPSRWALFTHTGP
jgi:hypothetical protein